MSKEVKKYFIQEHLQEPYQNGGIGYTDAERILTSSGYEPVFLPAHFDFSFVAKLRRLLFVIGKFISLPSGSIVVFLLPQYAGMNRLLVRLLHLRKSIKRVALVGDINGIKHNDPALLKIELRQYSQYDFLIVHNQWMRDWIEKQIPGARCSVLHFFDFLAGPGKQKNEHDYSIAYAGNLLEAKFLNKVGELSFKNSNIVFKVYGQPYTSQMAEQINLEYLGTSEPYTLPAKISAAYGLVWYGESMDAVLGNIGPYLSLISPHKASLYLICGIPLIVPEGTAIAGLVKQHKAGIAINNLHELADKLKAINKEEYSLMCQNAMAIGRGISKGEGLRNALHEMENTLLPHMQKALIRGL